MHAQTVHQLNEINRRFYNAVAVNFDATRQHPWLGWERLLAHIPARRPLRVLDVGCGNGRFGVFLADQLTGDLHYTGVDNNPVLLHLAAGALDARANVQTALLSGDFVTQPPLSGAFDMVALFGVLHHIPGAENRRKLLASLAETLAPGGVLAFAAWRFMDVPRLRAKVVAWEDALEREEGDYLLDWRRGVNTVRYCHHVDDAEHDTLTAATGLTELATYRADGHDGITNRYSVLG